MHRSTVLAAACSLALVAVAHAAPPAAAPPPPPQRATAEPGAQVYKSMTLSSDPYEPKTQLPQADAIPNCQIKIGGDWSETPARTLEDCAALLDQKTPADPKPMSTAYWNNLYLSADDKSIYQANADATAWSVLRARGGH